MRDRAELVERLLLTSWTGVACAGRGCGAL